MVAVWYASKGQSIKSEHELFDNFSILVLKKVFKALITNLATSKLLFRYLFFNY